MREAESSFGSIERVELERAPGTLAVTHVLFGIGAVVERCDDAYHLDNLYTVPKELSYQELPYIYCYERLRLGLARVRSWVPRPARPPGRQP